LHTLWRSPPDSTVVGPVGKGEGLGLGQGLLRQRAHLAFGQPVAMGEQAECCDLQAG